MQENTTEGKLRVVLLASAMALVTGCQATQGPDGDIDSVDGARATQVDNSLREIVERHDINTAGVALIKGGQIEWQGYYGMQSDGVPASPSTLFNVASMTKTVTTETILRLVDDGRLELDEPMARYWVDPDLQNEPNVNLLTARMALTHTTGFMNWRFQTDDFKLRFLEQPGAKFGYSGEGFQYLARYAENKLDTPFEELVKATIFLPLGIRDASISVRKENFERIAKPLDADGDFYGYYCHPTGYCRDEGSYSAAGDMVITVADFARFLISAMQPSLSASLLEQRNRIHVTSYEIDCQASPDALCPRRVGYGLGWSIVELDDGILIGHTGSDWSSVALAYYYAQSGDGLVAVFNAPNRAGIVAMVETLELLDPNSPRLHEYRTRRDR